MHILVENSAPARSAQPQMGTWKLPGCVWCVCVCVCATGTHYVRVRAAQTHARYSIKHIYIFYIAHIQVMHVEECSVFLQNP